MLGSEFTAQHRAEYEIMKIALKTVQAKHSCNLGPVTYFVRQDMDNNLLRRCLQGPTNKLEILRMSQLGAGKPSMKSLRPCRLC